MRPLTTRPAATTCEHGRLARSCEVCGLLAELAEARALLAAYLVPESEGGLTSAAYEQLVREHLRTAPPLT